MAKPGDYPRLLSEVKERIRSAQYEALKAVNKELVGLYWDIGRMIVERQDVEGWGKAVVEQLAADLRMEFPGVGGFSASNLWRMKAFFEAYSGLEKLAPLVREIGWSHNLAILGLPLIASEKDKVIDLTQSLNIRQNELFCLMGKEGCKNINVVFRHPRDFKSRVSSFIKHQILSLVRLQIERGYRKPVDPIPFAKAIQEKILLFTQCQHLGPPVNGYVC
jgi:hypothetical protein